MTVHRRNSPESRTPLAPEVIAVIRQAAIDGKTIKQAAALVGISYIRVYNLARKLELPFTRQSRFFGRAVSDPPSDEPGGSAGCPPHALHRPEEATEQMVSA